MGFLQTPFFLISDSDTFYFILNSERTTKQIIDFRSPERTKRLLPYYTLLR